MIATLDHSSIGEMKTVGLPVKLRPRPDRLRTAPAGEHTRRVLAGDGTRRDAIASLEHRGVIRCG
jgi:crotonobetainyl-CoA:carnitine CoA-transferase CaiB-like acyl-CoA transferase